MRYYLKEKGSNMELDEYKNVVSERYMALSDEEKTILESIPDSPVGDVLGKLFGPEMADVIGDTPEEVPLDETTAAIPTDMDMATDMPPAGTVV